MKKVNLKEVLHSKAVIVTAVVMVVAVGAFTLVNAFSGGAFVNIENAQFGDVALNGEVQGGGDQLGAYGDTNFTNLVASGSLTVTGASTLTGAISSSGAISGASGSFSGAMDVGNFTQGGGCYASTTVAATDTWTAANMLAYNCFEYNGATAAAITITLPATSTMTTLIPNVGDKKSWLYQGYTVAATTTTWTAGTGMDLIGYTTDDDVIDGNEYAEIKCTRMTDTDVTCIVSELLHTD